MEAKTWSDLKDTVFAINAANQKIRMYQALINGKILELSALVMALKPEDKNKLRLKIEQDEITIMINEKTEENTK